MSLFLVWACTNIKVEGYIVVGQLMCLNLESEWVDVLFLLTHSCCSLQYIPQLRQWETSLKNLGRAEHEHSATDGIFFFFQFGDF
jgi:hypothetical protein